MGDAEASEAIFYHYRSAKRVWRRFTGKPVRKFRRYFKRTIRRKGEGPSEGKGRGFFYTQDDVQWRKCHALQDVQQ